MPATDLEDCTNERVECDVCELPVCRRCGRCFEKVPTPIPGHIGIQCPSFWCRLRKRLRRRPLRRSDTPRDAACTGD